jgi:hypothetical protein
MSRAGASLSSDPCRLLSPCVCWCAFLSIAGYRTGRPLHSSPSAPGWFGCVVLCGPQQAALCVCVLDRLPLQVQSWAAVMSDGCQAVLCCWGIAVFVCWHNPGAARILRCLMAEAFVGVSFFLWQTAAPWPHTSEVRGVACMLHAVAFFAGQTGANFDCCWVRRAATHSVCKLWLVFAPSFVRSRSTVVPRCDRMVVVVTKLCC